MIQKKKSHKILNRFFFPFLSRQRKKRKMLRNPPNGVRRRRRRRTKTTRRKAEEEKRSEGFQRRKIPSEWKISWKKTRKNKDGRKQGKEEAAGFEFPDLELEAAGRRMEDVLLHIGCGPAGGTELRRTRNNYRWEKYIFFKRTGITVKLF